MSFHTFLSWRYFRSRKGFLSVVSGFSLTGIILGVGALIVVMAVMAGFRAELMNRILGIAGHATISQSGMTFANAQTLGDKVVTLKGVHSAEPFIQGQSMMVDNGRAQGAMVKGVDFESGQDIIFDHIIEGSLEEATLPNRIIIGDAMARKNGLGVGSVVTLLSPQGSYTVVGFIPRMKKFKVAAIFDVGMHIYDSSWMYMTIPNAQKFYGLGETVTALDVRVDAPEETGYLIEPFYDAAGEGAFVSTWQDNNRQFFQALEVERVAMFIILSLVVVIAAFNIITGQMMTVNDKRGDIAILRTMGARRRDVLQIFMINGTLIGLIGTTLGVVGGLLIVQNLDPIVTLIEDVFGVAIFRGEAYFLTELPARIIWDDVIGVASLSMALSMLASLAPAYKAAKMDPVEVLRSE